jgi:hypothetical protein
MYATKAQNLKIALGIVIALLSLTSYAQTQVVKGKIIDATAEYVLIGATIQLLDHEPVIGTVTDISGEFRLENVPVGRHNFSVSYVGYKTITLPNVLVTSGKEVILSVKLEESVQNLAEIVITAEADKDLPINELAKVSARTFSLEEVTRFSGGRNDVARLATSFAGVSAPNDSRNDIVVRGNSPNGLLWRVEGIPIATTNHFATLGTTGGPVNALNTNLLRTSDFLTGAFPAEYGNANAAVFDIQFRNGNTDTYEFTGQMGFNGAELMAEGPLNRKNDGSFLASYRYGIASVAATGTSAIPYYQDFSFKVNLGNGKLGRFELFGLGALSHIDFLSEEIDESDLFADPNADSYVNNELGIVGISHLLRMNHKGFLKTTIGVSGNGNEYLQDNYLRDVDGNKTTKYRATEVDNFETRYTLSSSLNQKYNAQWSMKAGVLAEIYQPNYLTKDRSMRIDIPDADSDGVPDYFITVSDMQELYSLTQVFAQAEYRLSDNLSTTFGLHGQYFDVNDQLAVEPRGAISWQSSERTRWSLAYGMHSQITPAPILFLETEVSPGNFVRTNENLDFSKSHHFVIGYDQNLGVDWRFKAEAYYQALSDVPVESISSSYSVLNEGADFAFNEQPNLVNQGKGTNYGIEATLEKFFSNNYYLLMTTSIYESTYEGSDGVERSTAFNNNYVFNLLGGREWPFGKNGQNAFTLDTKVTTAGGKPYTPVDLAATRANGGREVRDDALAFSESYGDYFRWDVKLGVRLNKPGKKISQQFYVDLQNVTNRENEFVRRYNSVTDEVNLITQIGFFPDVMYRIQF